MARHLLGAKPLPEPMMTHYQLEPQKQTLMKFLLKTISIEEVVC